ncbi:EAL domain-containing protein (putative c-di-GMP-specific phosphodiesterase class I) [Tamilnaduibacter salinus]|nr:EAL domain-containing protein [Tamilnaduibacter salinus]PVY75872.1 EAL domain-containing protein (putative c-di-GMP-specific phosphodiesterase class I) [Tamilnaduibacter salinus]
MLNGRFGADETTDHLFTSACRMLVFLCLLATPLPSVSDTTLPVVTVSEDRGELDLAGRVALFVEPAPFNIDQVRRQPASAWQLPPHGINAGYDRSGHWVRLILRNPYDRPVKRLIQLEYPLLDHIEFYHMRRGFMLDQAVTGDTQPFSQRPLPQPDFVFPVTIPPDSDTHTYLRIRTDGSVQAPLKLWQEEAYYADREITLIWRSVFYGMLIVFAAFNLFLFMSSREPAHLSYVFLVLSVLALVMTITGFSYQHFYPEVPWLNNEATLVVVPLFLLALCLFNSSFLKLQQSHPKMHRLLQVMTIGSGLCVLGAFILPYAISTRLSVLIGIPVATINLMAGLMLFRQRETEIRLFSFAWALMVVGILATGLSKVGVIPNLEIVQHSIPIGTTLQAVLFSLALAVRFNRQRVAYFQARQHQAEAMEQQKSAEAALYRAASHNEITGLPNRGMFERALQNNLESLKPPELIGVFKLQIHDFEEIYKTLGYEHAEQLLARFARRLNERAVRTDEVSVIERGPYGHFSVSQVDSSTFALLTRGHSRTRLLERVQSATDPLRQPIDFMGLSLEMPFSVGCSFATTITDDVQSLLRESAIALDHAGNLDTFATMYDPVMNPYSPDRLTLMTDLREAIRRNELSLHLQPQRHLESGLVSGFEALVRWPHGRRGPIPPDEFIPVAERTGLIRPLTRWVLDEALRFCERLNEVDDSLTVSINISAVNLRDPEFIRDVLNLLDAHRMAATRLKLEVTETAAMEEPLRSLAVLSELRDHGISLSIDDFGTGHSSLSYLRRLPVDEIKIDRSFVMYMDANEGDATIVRATVNLCHDLGYQVVAEGVETQSVLDQLTAMGCDGAQGYYLSAPLPEDQLLEWLEQHHRGKQLLHQKTRRATE